MSKFLSDINLNSNVIINGAFESLSSAPLTPITGQFYYNSTDTVFYYYDGTNWVATGDKVSKKSYSYDAARNANVSNAQDLRRTNGVYTNIAPYIVPIDSEIYAVTAASDHTASVETWSGEIYINDVLSHTISIVTKLSEVSNGLSISVSSGDRIRMRFTPGNTGSVNKPSITVYLIEQ